MRRITKGFIRYISLCPRGVNQLPVIYKAEDETVQFNPIIKADMEQGLITAIVYAPETRDKEGDIASAEVIKEMAHEFSKNGHGVDIQHSNKALSKDDAYVAESFIVQKDDARFTDLKDFAGNPVNATGAWAVVIKVDSEPLREAYRKAEWNSVSMGGTAKVISEKSDASSVANALALKLNGESDMSITKDEMVAALADCNKVMLKGITEALAPKVEKVEKSDDNDAPIFKGDAMNLEDVQAHAEAVAAHDITKNLDWSDSKAVAKHQVMLKEKHDEKADAEKKKKDAEKKKNLKKSDELVAAEKRVTELEKSSNQSTSDTSGSENETELEKEDRECREVAVKMAKHVNESLTHCG